MKTGTIVLIVIIAIMVGILVALYFFGKKMQNKQEESQKSIEAHAQQVSMLVIDKKVMRFKDADLPAAVKEQTPWYLRRSKIAIVKAKVGPKIMQFICDEKIFEIIPVKREVKATVSGIYITGVKALRGQLDTPQKKKGFFSRFRKEK